MFKRTEIVFPSKKNPFSAGCTRGWNIAYFGDPEGHLIEAKYYENGAR
jgi:hypothetical protein